MLTAGAKLRTAVLVSGGGTNLQAILNACADGAVRHAEVTLVVSNNPNAYALQRAAQAGVPAIVLQRRELGGSEGFERELIRVLEEHRIDLIVLAGFMTILSESFTRRYDHRILNVHPSLIPAFCGKGFYGLEVHRRALARGVKVTGATVHFVNEVPDGGEILLQKAVEILPEDTPESLQRRVMEQAEWILLPRAIEMIAEKSLSKEN